MNFYDWCYNNNKMGFINAWYENDISPKEVSFSEHKKYKFKCSECGTIREYLLNSITNMNISLKCPFCNSFGKWCIDNNPSLLNRIDCSKTEFDIYKIPKGSKKSIYLKCSKNKHESEPQVIKTIAKGLTNCECKKCSSFAEWGIENISDDFLVKYWDFDLNNADPYNIAMSNRIQYIWLKCTETNYHGSYKTKAIDVTRYKEKITCPYCFNMRVHKSDSIGCVYPDIFKIWSDKNKSTPYEYKQKSGRKVWLKCKCGKHSDTLRTLDNAYSNNYECPDCIKERDESKIEETVRLYLNNELRLDTLHEFKCTILPKNPKTNYPLPFDNEVIKYKLIIEVHGIQHYQITNFAKMSAKNFGTTPEYELEYLQWKDNYKKEFALSHGYKYLALSYKEINNGKYKIIINNKINEILKEVA